MKNSRVTENELAVLFSLKKVSRVFGRRRLALLPDKRVMALDDVSIEIYSKEAIGIVGESGSGKTTLGRILVNLDQPTTGKVFFRGQEIGQFKKGEMKKFHHAVQMIFQNPFAALNPYRSVKDIIGSGYKSLGKIKQSEMNEKLLKLIDSVGLNAEALDRFPHQFSGGQRQRIVIARALSVKPEVLVADEPVSALDVSIQAQVLNLLNDLRRSLGLTVVFITHDLRVANFFCDRIAVMYRGRIVELGRTKDVIENSCHPYTRMLMDAAPGGESTKEGRNLLDDTSIEISPQPLALEENCNFADRCWMRKTLPDDSRCLTEKPQQRLVNGTNLVECHHAELVSDQLLQLSSSRETLGK